MNRTMFSRLFCSAIPTKGRKRRTTNAPLPSAVVSLEQRIMLSAISALQTPLQPTTHDLGSLMSDLTNTNSGALSSIVNIVNAAESSVSSLVPAGNVAAARSGLNLELTSLASQLTTLKGELSFDGVRLPDAVTGSLQQSVEYLGASVEGFANSMFNVIDAVDLAKNELPSLTVSTLTGGEIAHISGAPAPVSVNGLGQQLENLLGNLAENTSTFLSDLNNLDGVSAPVGTITGTVTNTAGGAGIANVVVELINATGVVVESTVTNSTGHYSLTVDQTGAYAVREVTPTGYTQITPTFSSAAPVAQTGAPKAGAFGYYGSTTVLPSNWDADAPFGGDPDQSPINITGPTVNLQSPGLLTNLGQFVSNTIVAANTVNVTNTGFQLKVTIPQGNPADPAPTINLDGTTYTLQQFHYHDTSENTVNGQSYPMEEHLVFTSASGAEMVLAVFVQVGAANSSFQSILDAAANLGSAANSTRPITGAMNFSNLIPAQTQGWFYQGSLTTPPLSAPVNWMVLSTPITISAAQLQQYETAAGDLGFLPNARPVQPLDGRQLNQIDNYVNVQGSQNFTVEGQAITSVDFTLSGAGNVPSAGATTGSTKSQVLDAAAVGIASSLNNLQSSANVLDGLLGEITGNPIWSSSFLETVTIDFERIEFDVTANLGVFNAIVIAANTLSPADAQMILQGTVPEASSIVGNIAASLNGINLELPKTGTRALVTQSNRLSAVISAFTNRLSHMAPNGA